MENIISILENIYSIRNIYQTLIVYDDITVSKQYFNALTNLDYDCILYTKENFEDINTIQYYEDIKEHRCFFVPVCCLLRYSCILWNEMANFSLVLALSPETYQYQKNLFSIIQTTNKNMQFSRITICAY